MAGCCVDARAVLRRKDSPAKKSEASPETKRRAVDTILGQFVGDALGTRYEFMTHGDAVAAVDEDLRNSSGDLNVLGGGPFNLIPGQVTDDTELAMALARSLIRKGTYDAEDVASSYHTWYRSSPFDIGNTTRIAFAGGSRTRGSIHKRIMANSDVGNQGSLSNGCLMRASPFGVAGWNWESEKLVDAAKLDCRLTNPHPVAQDAVAAYVVAIATGVRTGDPTAAYDAAVAAAATDTIEGILEQSRLAFNAEVTPGGMGYLGIALQMAFHELLQTEHSFRDSLTRVVRFGGDTDTNGCITGALIGAVKGGIPEQWSTAVKKCNPKRRLAAYPWVTASDLEDVALVLLETKAP